MEQGDLDTWTLLGMATRAADPQTSGAERAKDAFKVLPKLTPADLQHCIAFNVDPFSWLAAKLLEKERSQREEATAGYYREREARGVAELARLRAL